MNMDKQVIDIDSYMQELSGHLFAHFPRRILYLGLQGSYGRGEATPDSDIDIFLVLDILTVKDLDTYRKIINSMNYADKSCGFICGRQELLNWNPGEICQLSHETKDYWGQLKTLLPDYTDIDVINYIKRQVGDLYHQLCHQYIHGVDSYTLSELRQAYKSVFYILQNKYYLQKGNFVLSKKDLLFLLTGIDQQVLEVSLLLKEEKIEDLSQYYELLFSWCQYQLHNL